jgi:hypothetical protein
MPDMSQPRIAPSQPWAYLQDSPIGQLVHWIAGSKSLLSHNDTLGPQDNGCESGYDKTMQEGTVKTGDAIEGINTLVDSQSGTRNAIKHERHNEAHYWSLARRISVAGIICFYT